jgi:capsular polysaccharide biosynthesis protein
VNTRLITVAIAASLLVAMAVTSFSLRQPIEYETSARVLVGPKEQVDARPHPIPTTIARAPRSRHLRPLRGTCTGTLAPSRGRGPAETPSGTPRGAPCSFAPTQEHVRAMALFIDSRPVAKETIRRLGLRITPDELLDNLTVEPLEGTMLIQLTYTDTDPYRAKDVVNTVSQVASERISNTGGILSHITAVVWRKASLPNTPVSPNPLRNGLIALVVALALSAALMIAVRERLRR